MEREKKEKQEKEKREKAHIPHIPPSNFKLLTLLGEGSHGQVWKGSFTTRDKGTMDCAIKIYKTVSSTDFTTEIKNMKNLSHPNVVKLYGYCVNLMLKNKNGEQYCLIMELCERSLAELLFKKKFPSVPNLRF